MNCVISRYAEEYKIFYRHLVKYFIEFITNYHLAFLGIVNLRPVTQTGVVFELLFLFQGISF